MSKAEEFAYSKYPKDKKGVLYDLARNSIIQGYHQAEKDLELTWEDIKLIGEIIDDVIVENLHNEKWFEEDLYQEVLKRFKKINFNNMILIISSIYLIGLFLMLYEVYKAPAIEDYDI